MVVFYYRIFQNRGPRCPRNGGMRHVLHTPPHEEVHAFFVSEED